MFEKRCTLCGGKLNSKRICTECGLDNNRSEKYYKVNESSCDGMPLTHTHPDDGEQNESKWDDVRRYTLKQFQSKRQESKQRVPEQYGRKQQKSGQYESKQYGFRPSQGKKTEEKKAARKDVRWEYTGTNSKRRKKGGWAKKIASLFVVGLSNICYTILNKFL